MNPYQNTPTATLIADRVRDLSHRKSLAEIDSEAGFAIANMMTCLKNGRNMVPLDQAVGVTAAKATTEIFGTPVTENDRGWLAEIRDASDNSDPRLTGRSCTAGPHRMTRRDMDDTTFTLPHGPVRVVGGVDPEQARMGRVHPHHQLRQRPQGNARADALAVRGA